MVMIKRLRGWEVPESEATPESIYYNRRQILKGVTGLTIGSMIVSTPTHDAHSNETDPLITGKQEHPPAANQYPATRNPLFALDRPITNERVAATFNNFYEFDGTSKTTIWKLIEHFKTHPWRVKVGGLVKQHTIYDIDDLIRRMPIEERLYRLRCVEAWAMAVPWTGFPMKKLIDLVQPLSSAKFVKMTSFMDPDNALGQKPYFGLIPSGPWPYTESLSMEEATNELTMLVSGIYGHPLLKQHGAPIRLIAPWKYGFKSIKSIVSIEFVKEQPSTFWNTSMPHEYDLIANVNPAISHRRWSQSSERIIGTNDERRPTMLYNGYERWVSHLYTT
tara:strand:+ start:2056 stop:3057 length:1002 start_codon:yes stop_codon:yes gene_type:complete